MNQEIEEHLQGVHKWLDLRRSKLLESPAGRSPAWKGGDSTDSAPRTDVGREEQMEGAYDVNAIVNLITFDDCSRT